MTKLKTTIAAFDFDGTLTYSDTLIPFLKSTFGIKKTAINLFLLLPEFILFLLGKRTRQDIKEKILTSFLKGISLTEVELMGEKFAKGVLLNLIKPYGLKRLKWHKERGDICVLISANLSFYLDPLANQLQFDYLLASNAAVDINHSLTGKLEGKNCYGQEKVNRLIEFFGPKSDYTLYAYGNSRGDKELLELADFPYFQNFDKLQRYHNLEDIMTKGLILSCCLFFFSYSYSIENVKEEFRIEAGKKDKHLIKKPTAFRESLLAHQLLDGKRGIEIGASIHNQFGLNTLNVDYTDDYNTPFKLEEKNMFGYCLKVDIVAPGDDLPFKDNVWDFVINSHVIEHFYDPIKTVKEWLRVVKPGGLVYMIIPHKERTFDRDRPRTSLAEIIQNHDFPNPPIPDHHGHYSVWITQDFIDICDYYKWPIVAVQDVDDKVGNGFTIVIQKP